MDKQFSIEFYEDKWLLTFDSSGFSFTDISRMLCTSTLKIKNRLVKKCNGLRLGKSIIFKCESDALLGCEWLNSLLMIAKMNGNLNNYI